MKALENLIISTDSIQKDSPLDLVSKLRNSAKFLNKFKFLDLVFKIILFKCFLLRCLFFTGLFSVFTRVAAADNESAFDDNSFYSQDSDLVHNNSTNNDDVVEGEQVAVDNINFNSDYYNILAINQNYSNQQEEKSKGSAGEGFNYLAKVETGAKFSSKRNIGDGKILIPIYQSKDGDQLLFTDLRGRFDNLGSSEYNIGLGYRKLLNNTSFLGQDQWIIGVYSFFDRLITASSNSFNQVTIGLETLSNEYDFRSNIYLPEDKEAVINDSFVSEAKNGRLSVDYLKEKPLKGGDFEFGYKLPLKFANTKIFAGGYYYKGDGEYQSIVGSKYRAEITFDRDNISFLPKNTQLTLGSEYQYDKQRGAKISGIIKASYQFGVIGNTNSNSSNIKSRMNEFLIRDIDIVTNQKEFYEKAITSLDGANREIFIINSTDNLKSTIQNAPNNALIILDGSNGDFVAEAQTDLKSGQIISGQRDSLVITSSGMDGRGYNVKLNTNKARLISNSDISDSYLIGLSDNNVIENLDIYFDAGDGQKYLTSGNAKIINVDGKNQVIINKVGFSSNYYNSDNPDSSPKDLAAIYVNDSSNVTIVGNNSHDQADISGYNNAVEIHNSTGSINISGMNISNNQGVGIMVDNTDNVNLDNVTSNHNSVGIEVNDSGNLNLSRQVSASYNSTSGIEITNLGNFNNFSNLDASYNQQDGIVINNAIVNNFNVLNANHNANGITLKKVSNSNFSDINADQNSGYGIFIQCGIGIVSNSINVSGNGVAIKLRSVSQVTINNVTTDDQIIVSDDSAGKVTIGKINISD